MEPLPLFAGDGTDAALFSSLWSFQDDLHQQPQEVYSSPSLLLQHFLACSKQWLVDSRVCCRDGRRRSRPRFPFHSLWSRGVRQPTGEGFETPWHVTYWNSPRLFSSLISLCLWWSCMFGWPRGKSHLFVSFFLDKPFVSLQHKRLGTVLQ
jgi:hypothetical protein